MDGLAGPVTVEVWSWQKPAKRVALGAENHQGIVNALLYHPTEPWLIGARRTIRTAKTWDWRSACAR